MNKERDYLTATNDVADYHFGRPATPWEPYPAKPGEGVNMSELMKVADFLSSYAISRTEFYRQVNAGRIRITKLGSASRVARPDAEAWLASLPVKQGSQAHG